MPDTRSQRNDADGNYARFVGLGITLILIFGLPTVVGFFVDSVAGTLPPFLLVGLGGGAGGGVRRGDVLRVPGAAEAGWMMGDHWRLAFRCAAWIVALMVPVAALLL